MYRLNKVRSTAIITIGGTFAFIGINLVKGNEKFYHDFAMPAIHKLLEPEKAHLFAIKLTKHGLVPNLENNFNNEMLKIKAFGKEFDNPIGCAAGFDKHGEAMSGLYKFGFGFVEIGSVTPLPQDGNPKPRLFRLSEDFAVINRYGFNSEGHEQVLKRVEDFKNDTNNSKRILGINLGKNKESTSPHDDYVLGIRRFAQSATYIVINISSPNTPGLRNLQKRQELETLVDKVLDERNKTRKDLPVIFKISPDLTDDELKDIATVVTRKNKQVDGLIICNTTIKRPEELKSGLKNETGGLSGRPLKNVSNEIIKKMFTLTNGKIPIIGVGGIENGADVLEKLKCGASLIQLYTALIYEGPPLINKIKVELTDLLKQEGFSNAQEVIGYYHKK